MTEQYDFIHEVNGEPYLEISASGEYVALEAVHDVYDQSLDLQDTAEAFMIDPEDVANALKYWVNNPEVRQEFGSDEKQSSETGDNALDDFDLSEMTKIERAKNVFTKMLYSLDLGSPDLEKMPEESFFGKRSSYEIQFDYEIHGSDVSLYAGLETDGDRGLISFAVDGEEGEELVVEDEAFENAIKDVNNIAVFEALER